MKSHDLLVLNRTCLSDRNRNTIELTVNITDEGIEDNYNSWELYLVNFWASLSASCRLLQFLLSLDPLFLFI